jgi:hypothetical protein
MEAGNPTSHTTSLPTSMRPCYVYSPARALCAHSFYAFNCHCTLQLCTQGGVKDSRCVGLATASEKGRTGGTGTHPALMGGMRQ